VRRAALLLAVLTFAGCGESGDDANTTATAPAAEWTTYRDDANGFAVSYPTDWFRADENLTPRLADPREILSLGTYPLRRGSDRCAQHIPVNALADLGPTDAFLTLQEREDPSTERSDPRPSPFPLGPDTQDDADVCLPTREPLTMWVPFEDRGRAFYALYVLGPEATRETRAELVRILDRLEFDPRQ
jgi:hypothetical protein